MPLCKCYTMLSGAENGDLWSFTKPAPILSEKYSQHHNPTTRSPTYTPHIFSHIYSHSSEKSFEIQSDDVFIFRQFYNMSFANLSTRFSGLSPAVSRDISSAFFLTYRVTFFLAFFSPFFLAFMQTFFLTCLVGIFFEMSFHILFDQSSGILSGIFF